MPDINDFLRAIHTDEELRARIRRGATRRLVEFGAAQGYTFTEADVEAHWEVFESEYRNIATRAASA